MLTTFLAFLPSLGCFQSAPDAWQFSVDATSSKPISKYIYGANFPDWSKIDIPFPLARQGGNRLTAYNWENNASNAGNDNQNQSDDYMGASNEPGWTVRTFLESAQSHKAAALLTVACAGYVAADKNGGGDVNKTPDYLNVRFVKSYPKKPRHFAYPPDTTDHAVYQDEFVHWIETIKSAATPVWFSLDNEPDIWVSTHARIWTRQPGYADIISIDQQYAAAIKDVAPKTLVFGPANYGWQGFRTFQNAPDANGRDFLDVYLAAMRSAEKNRGHRLLDVLDIHWYPEAQGDGVRIAFGPDKPGTPAARIQAPRSLWDPTYVETSWITKSLDGRPINLLPMIQDKIQRFYPGTKLCISEYNYGGEKVISGALAQADVLGLFGRYGLFAACNFGIGPNDTGLLAGFRAFLSFDGHGAKFGDHELSVQGETASDNSLYAAEDSSNGQRITLVLINKTNSAHAAAISLHGFNATSAKAFVISATELAHSVAESAAVESGSVNVDLPAESIVSINVSS